MLASKLVAGPNIVLSTLSPGGDESLQIAVSLDTYARRRFSTDTRKKLSWMGT